MTLEQTESLLYPKLMHLCVYIYTSIHIYIYIYIYPFLFLKGGERGKGGTRGPHIAQHSENWDRAVHLLYVSIELEPTLTTHIFQTSESTEHQREILVWPTARGTQNSYVIDRP